MKTYINAFFITFIVFFVSQETFGQSETKLTFAISYSQGLSRYHAHGDEWFENFRNNYFERGNAFQVGAEIRKPIFKNAQLISGLVYAQYSESLTLDSFSLGDNIDARRGFVYGESKEVPDPTYFSRFIQVPLAIQYTLKLGNRSSILGSAGVSLAYLVGRIIQDPLDTVEGDQKEWEFDKKDFSLGTRVGLAYRFSIKQSYFIELGPMFEYFLTPFYQETSGDGRLAPMSGSVRLVVGF
jgi:hypothetical protein